MAGYTFGVSRIRVFILGCFVCIVAPGLLLISPDDAFSGRAMVYGDVIVYNNSPEPVEVLVKNFDYMGRAIWESIGMVYPGESRTFPRVPEKKLFGARSTSRSWEPIMILYNRAYQERQMPYGAPNLFEIFYR